jgi:DNA-binding GntR family transcriptional regulator
MPLALPKRPQHRTKQELVYRRLHAAISTCELQPGERLIIEDLARQLEVSAIPVREALQLLQSEGLVLNVPHVGATVAPISRESIVDVFAVLEGLESVAVRYAVERAGDADLDAIGQLVSRMDEVVATGKYDLWSGLNSEFHLSISARTGLQLLHEMTTRVLARWDRVRRYYFQDVLLHRVAQAQDEHRQMLVALRAHDVDRLVDLARQHNRGALAAYMTYLSSDAEPSVPDPQLSSPASPEHSRTP